MRILSLNTAAASFTGKLNGDTLTVSATGAFENANAGEDKTVVISGLTLGGTDKDNYVLATEGQQTNATAKISAKEIGLTWSNTDLIYNGLTQAPTATATGLVSGDTCTVTVSGEQTNVGNNYTATASSLSNGNYKLPENKTTTFKINNADREQGGCHCCHRYREQPDLRRYGEAASDCYRRNNRRNIEVCCYHREPGTE